MTETLTIDPDASMFHKIKPNRFNRKYVIKSKNVYNGNINEGFD